MFAEPHFILEVLSAFDKNGKPLEKGTLKNGKGTIHYYDDKGNFVKSERYRMGILIRENTTKKLK